MLARFARLWISVALVAILWTLGFLRPSDERSWLRPSGVQPGPVKILRFYASVGSITRGEKARLCYGVENARSVRISPMLQGIYPSEKRCLEIVPEHTTHYTLLAEGFDGRVAVQSLTLPVQPRPSPPPHVLLFAGGTEKDGSAGYSAAVESAAGGSRSFS